MQLDTWVVTPPFVTAFFGLLLVLALGLVVWRIVDSGRQRPERARFLRLAYGLCTGGIAIVLLATAMLAVTTVFGDDSVSVGEPIAVGSGGVEVEAPISISFGRGGDDESYTQQVAEYYGDGARIYEGREVSVAVTEPSAELWALAIGTILVGFAFALAWLVTLRAMLGRTLAGEPFHVDNVRGLRRLALLTLAWGLVLPFLRQFALSAVIREAGGSESAELDLSLWAPATVSVLLLALAEVWGYGIHLQRDAETTV